MLRPLIRPLIAGLAGLALSGSVATADPVFPPGLRIGLQPPGDMTVSKRFAGFEDADRKAAIVLLDLPEGAYQEVERSAFAQSHKDLSKLKRESFPFANGIGVLVSGTATENGVAVHKWFLMATAVSGKVENLAMLASAQVPEPARKIYPDATIRKALASITFRPAPIQEQLGLIPFKVNDLAGFRVVQVMPTGGVVLTDGPADDLTRQPYMIVTIGPNAPTDPADRARFANDMLSNMPLRGFKIQNAESMRITGAAGFEIRGQAEGPNATPVSMVQWLRFSGTGYLRVVGVGKREEWDKLFNRFRAVRDGIAFR
ncbi:MAG: hypothetical protein GC182_14525 [Rhodopseudomonas sp.]|nr:hypothetical protein [Rhodopseudomonas sp.]